MPNPIKAAPEPVTKAVKLVKSILNPIKTALKPVIKAVKLIKSIPNLIKIILKPVKPAKPETDPDSIFIKNLEDLSSRLVPD